MYTLIDEVTREYLVLEVASSITGVKAMNGHMTTP